MKKQILLYIAVLILLLPVAALCAGPLARVYIAPQDVGLAAGITQQFKVIGEDTDGNPVTVPTPITWSAVSASGTITSAGLFTAGTTPGRYWGVVTATIPGDFTCSANVEVYSNEIRNGYIVERSIGSLNAGLFDSPIAIAIDQHNCVYILSRDSNMVTRLDISGSFLSRFKLTQAVPGEAAMAVDMNGNIYVLDRVTPRVTKYSSTGTQLATWGYPGSGGLGKFNNPGDVATDWNGNVYVADTDDHRVEVYDSQGSPVAEWSIPGAYGEEIAPTSLCVDPCNTLYVAGYTYDSHIEEIVKLDSQGQEIWSWSAPFGTCIDLAVDTTGSCFTLTDLITKINPSVYQWPEFGGFGSETGSFDGASGIATDSTDRIYVADTNNNRIQVFDGTGNLVAVWDSSGSAKGQFSSPSSVSVDSSGNFLVADTGNYRVQKFAANGGFVNEFSSIYQKETAFSCPAGITLDSQGNTYVSDAMNNRVLKYSSASTYQSTWTLPEPAGSSPSPIQISTIPTGGFYLADAGRDLILKLTSTGSVITSWGQHGSSNGEFNVPVGTAVDSSGNVYISDSGNNRIQKLNSSGAFISSWGATGTGNGDFTSPAGISCENTNLYVADSGNCRIQKFSTSGTYTSQLGAQGTTKFEFMHPEGVAAKTNNIYVADSRNHRIIKFAPAPSRTISVSINSPTTNDTYSTTSQSISISGSILGTPLSVTWNNDRGGSGNCSGSTSWNASGITLYPGPNVISVKARNSTYTVTDTIVVYYAPVYETTAPTINITSPATDPIYIPRGSALTITGNASDNVGVTSVIWSNSRGGGGTCTGTTSWSVNPLLWMGDNLITVVARDAAGNVAADTIKVCNGDFILPNVTINYPTQDAGYATDSTSVLIKGIMGDNARVTRLTWKDSKGYNSEYDIPFTSTDWQANIPLIGPVSEIVITARDAAGNAGTDSLVVYNKLNHVGSISDAKKLADGKTVALSDRAVTAVFSDTIYIEEQSRQSGIKVKFINTVNNVAVGSRVDVAGELSSHFIEKMITGVVNVTGTGPIIQPIGMPCRAVGGSNWFYDSSSGSGQRGVPGGVGLNNIGLLIRTWGVVTSATSYDIYIDDGSGLRDGSVSYPYKNPNVGIKIECGIGYTFAVGDYVQVTGISTPIWSSGARTIRTRGPADVVKIAHRQP